MEHNPALEVLTAIAELLTSVDLAAVAESSDAQIVAVMRAARKLRGRMDALACIATDLVNRRQASMKALATPTTSLIALDENLDNRQAAGQISLARGMVAHEAPRAAALEGRISAEQAAAISKGIAGLPALPEAVAGRVAEAYVAKARGVPAKQLPRLAPSILASVAPELALTTESLEERAARQREAAVAARKFAWGDDGEGSVWFKGQLPEVEAEPLVRTLTAIVAAGKREERQQVARLAKTGADRMAQRELRRERAMRTPWQRAADAVVELIGRLPSGGAKREARALIRVTVSLADLEQRAGGAVLDSGTALTAGQLRRLAAEAEIIPFVLGGASEILDQGRSRRLVTPAQRAALELRDGGCIFPACGRPPEECEAHHVNPWAAAGETNLDEVVLLCPHHHGIVEPDLAKPRKQWRVVFNPETARPEVVPPKRRDAG